jgi:hypothetical protein
MKTKAAKGGAYKKNGAKGGRARAPNGAEFFRFFQLRLKVRHKRKARSAAQMCSNLPTPSSAFLGAARASVGRLSEVRGPGLKGIGE